ncbi:hypothetical protein CLV58_109113 [Spirosoma oryzae]|uniref:Uncharacterized protein n=1 Tax=Spirosoma oryzae TaxID=1469603 RepID=A0A2T0SY91_9BACT|nr:hypothetical protein [Spirosoma oryzae]PRY38386.1 hypothetical protein CLV58_109113 [Spirosoma oryzae]
MTDFEVGDWIVCVNLDDPYSKAVGLEIGNRYQVTDLNWGLGYTQCVRCRQFKKHPNMDFDFWIYSYCFIKEDPFQTKVRQVRDQLNQP